MEIRYSQELVDGKRVRARSALSQKHHVRIRVIKYEVNGAAPDCSVVSIHRFRGCLSVFRPCPSLTLHSTAPPDSPL